jgi:two-component system chemotaxis response regulator CheB
VLTGMGDDGTRGLQVLSAAGSSTFAQDEASCVVYGMPRAAVAAGAITHVAPLQELGSLICSLVGRATPTITD